MSINYRDIWFDQNVNNGWVIKAANKNLYKNELG